MKSLAILSIILLFILIIVLITRSKKSLNIDCLVDDWTDYSNCSRDCGGGVKTRTRAIIKNSAGAGLGCPSLRETEVCNTNPCNRVVSYAYDGTITVDRLALTGSGSGSADATLGIINEDFIFSGYKLSSTSAQSDGFKLGFFEIQFKRDGEIFGSFTIPSLRFLDTDVVLDYPYPDLKQGDIVSLLVHTENGSLFSITNPTVTFNLDIDCLVDDFVDQTEESQECLDSQGNIISCVDQTNCIDTRGNIVECRGSKTQVRSVIQPPLYGGRECPALTQTVDCSPCPILSYSYDGAITLVNTTAGEQSKTETIGIINTDFFITNINVDLNFSDINFDDETTYISFYITEKNEQGGEPVQFDIKFDKSNPTQYLDTPKLLKKYDKIMVEIYAYSGYSITLINPTITFNIAPVDCQVSEFGEFSPCTRECGGGTKTRSRNVVVPRAGAGAACPPLQETVECNTQPCPFSFSGDITLSPGSGVFGGVDNSGC